MSDYRMTVRFTIFLKVAEANAIGPLEKTFSVFLVFWPMGEFWAMDTCVNRVNAAFTT